MTEKLREVWKSLSGWMVLVIIFLAGIISTQAFNAIADVRAKCDVLQENKASLQDLARIESRLVQIDNKLTDYILRERK